MPGLLKRRINLHFLVNPFYLYCIAFLLAIIVYLFQWSKIFPQLSSGLILFLGSTFILFIITGLKYGKRKQDYFRQFSFNPHVIAFIFWLIILLFAVNVLYMGYIPVLDRSHDYREFGMPVIDPVFNTLSIFFSLVIFHSFLDTKKWKFLIWFLIILILQIILFRRSTIVWIVTSSSFLYLLYKRKVSLLLIILSVISIPVLSYSFGIYGNIRSKLDKSFVLNVLGASDSFKNSGISYNHYITYLYVSSPLANLQENINKRDKQFKSDDIKDFMFYCIVPQSFTLRLEKSLNLHPPGCNLIIPELIVGSCFMISYCILGWGGMILMFMFLFGFIMACLFVIHRWDTFGMETLSLLSTTAALLIFSNFLNRLDVILMLFIYPVVFHFIFKRISKLKDHHIRVPLDTI